MFKFLTSKKGFTLVELLITLVLLGLGAFAVISIVNVSSRSFSKTEERFEKQEIVKDIAEVFQNKSKIGGSTSCSIFNSLCVLPEEGNADDAYSYLFLVPVFKNEDGTYDATYKYGDTLSATKMKAMAGYYLYRLDQGITFSYKENGELDVPCMNYGFPLYFEFSPYKDNGQNMAAANIRICALDNNTEFTTTSDGLTIIPSVPKSEDNIFYELTVRSHFPNMISNSSQLVVNASSGTKDQSGNYIPDEASYGETRIPAADKGCVMRLTVDTILAGDMAQAKSTVTSFCFIATASYGVNSGEVGLLCDFRDNVLLKNDLGKAFVKAYYTVSPSVAKVIENSEPLKAAVRTALKPCVVVAEYALNPDLLKSETPMILLFFASGLTLSASLVYFNKKRKKSF